MPLRGRRVRGWVVAVGVEPEADRDELRPLAKISSAGPPPELVELTEWAAWRWAGPRVAFLRAASPANMVAPGAGIPEPSPRPEAAPAADEEVEAIAAEAAAADRAVIEWPPAARMAELLRRLVAPDGSTLLIVPDAGRAQALARHLGAAGIAAPAFIGDAPAAVRTVAWREARGGGVAVVGGRAAAWAPVPDLAAAVIVDDADEALKDERAPAWHARDLVLERARRAGARVTVVSPSPTLEARALTHQPLRLPLDLARRGWGHVVVVDRRDDPPGSGMFSPALVEPLRRAAAEGRVVCVLNRKGRARLLACDACGSLARCDQCGAAIAEDEEGLACPVCEARRPRVCAECGSGVLRRIQPGISRLREELAALVPGATVEEVDAGGEAEPDSQVLIGTEAVLHRVERARLVAFLDFDQELLAPRFRAAEQAHWLLVRAIRLVGPRGQGGSILVQTRIPDHDVLGAAASADPDALAARELERRAALGLPPVRALAVAEGTADAVAVLADGLAAEPQVEVAGPVPATRGAERLLVRADTVAGLCDALAAAAPAAHHEGRVRIEVDPLRV